MKRSWSRRRRSFPGYELLTEYFVFPQKFLFFDVTGLGPEARRRFGERPDAAHRYLSRSATSSRWNGM